MNKDVIQTVGGYAIVALVLTLLVLLWSDSPKLGDFLEKLIAAEVLVIACCIILDHRD